MPLPLAASGFLSGWMLLCAVAAGIPIVLHYLNRRRVIETKWAAMELLLQVIRQQSRRIRLEQLLLLFLRIAIPLLLALGFARPYFDTATLTEDELSPPQRELHIIAIDTSYSMNYRVGGVTLLDTAKQRAKEIVTQSGDGDAFLLLTLASPPQAVVSIPTFDKQSVFSAIDGLAPSYETTDLAASIDLVQDFVESDKGDRLRRLPQVVLLSDFGDDAWAPNEALNTRLEQLVRGSALSYIPLSVERPSNYAITQIQLGGEKPIVDSQSQVDVTVKRFGFADSPEAVETLTLRVESNGRSVFSAPLALAAGETTTLPVSIRWDVPGTTTLVAKLSDDALATDNTRSHIVEVGPQCSILFVEETVGISRSMQLALTALPEMAKRYRITTTTPEQLTAQLAFGGKIWDTIVLHDLRVLSEPNRDSLVSYLNAGGGVLILHGKNTDAMGWSSVEDLLPYRLTTPSEIDLIGIDPLDYASPIVAPFNGYPEAGLLTTPIFRFWQVELAGEGVTVDLATESSAPLLLHSTGRNGRLVSCFFAPELANSSTGTTPWNAVATWPSFVPLVHQIVNFAMYDFSYGTVPVGQTLTGLYPSRSAKTNQARVYRPDKGIDTISTSTSGGSEMQEWNYPRTNLPGVYTVELPDQSTKSYAVNVLTKESGMTTVPLDKLPQPLAVSDASRNPTDQSMRPQQPITVGWWFILAAGLVMLCESVLAWWFGRRLG